MASEEYSDAELEEEPEYDEDEMSSVRTEKTRRTARSKGSITKKPQGSCGQNRACYSSISPGAPCAAPPRGVVSQMPVCVPSECRASPLSWLCPYTLYKKTTNAITGKRRCSTAPPVCPATKCCPPPKCPPKCPTQCPPKPCQSKPRCQVPCKSGPCPTGTCFSQQPCGPVMNYDTGVLTVWEDYQCPPRRCAVEIPVTVKSPTCPPPRPCIPQYLPNMVGNARSQPTTKYSSISGRRSGSTYA